MKLDHSLSKSESKTLDCPYHYGQYGLSGTQRPIPRFTQTGTDFHDYREQYVKHLVDTMQPQDKEWALAWLNRSGVDEEPYGMIAADIEEYEIDPDCVYGCELFLAVAEDMTPITGLVYPGPGKPPLPVPGQPAPYAHGSIDRLDISGNLAVIVDYKTNRSETTLYPYEADHYALLVFANFPAIEQVSFDWELIRLHRGKRAEYQRSDMPRLIRSLRDRVSLRQELADRFASGLPMVADPLAGLCSWCALNCPVRAAAARGEVPCVPIQTDEDVKTAAGMLVAIKSVTAQIEHQIKAYVDEKGDVDLPNGYEAALRMSITRVYKLRDVLSVLGIEIPEESERYNVRLNGLKIGSTELKNYAKAQSRAGLMGELETVCDSKTRVELRVGKKKPQKEGQSDD